MLRGWMQELKTQKPQEKAEMRSEETPAIINPPPYELNHMWTRSRARRDDKGLERNYTVLTQANQTESRPWTDLGAPSYLRPTLLREQAHVNRVSPYVANVRIQDGREDPAMIV